MVARKIPPEACLIPLGKEGVHERFHLSFHQHWMRMVRPTLQFLLTNAVLGVVGYITLGIVGVQDPTMRHVLLLTLIGLGFIVHMNFLARLYNYCLYVVIVTDKKVHRIKKTLVVVDDHQSIDLWMLQDINKYQHGFIQNVFGYGTLIIEAQETVMRLHYVPHITEKYRALLQLREQARAATMRDFQQEVVEDVEKDLQEKSTKTSPRSTEILYWQGAQPGG